MSGKPLAYRMRPRVIDEVVGQQHLVGEGNHSPDGQSKTIVIDDSIRSPWSRQNIHRQRHCR